MRAGGRIALWARWKSDERGLALVEFALMLPVMLVLYLGAYEASQAVGAYRKLSDTTVELANVVAQYTTMSSTDAGTWRARRLKSWLPCQRRTSPSCCR